MPVARENRHRYPVDWGSRIRPAILDRAGLRCECDGRCGRGHRGRCVERHGHPSQWGTPGYVIGLTIAHLDHIPEHNDPANLMALCAGCHIHYDREHHVQSRIERWQRELEQAGQEQLFAPAIVAPVVRPSVGDWGEPEPASSVPLSVQLLDPELRERLLAAVAEHSMLARAMAAARAELAAALQAAAGAGAQRAELARLAGVTKPTLYRLLHEHAAAQTALTEVS